jgi:micrococcal nuclease
MTRRTQKKLISLVASLIVIGISWLATKYPGTTANIIKTAPPGSYRVVKFDDGDTIVVDMNGTQEKIRFIGVDTPETHDPRKAVQCFGQAAATYTKQLIGDNPVRLEADSLSSNRDRYNRLLRYVYLPDGRLVQAELIKNGYGFAYTGFPFTKSDKFVQYQREAREGNRGLWKDCSPTVNDFGGFTSNDAQ